MEMISIGNQCDVASTTAPPLFTNRWSKRTPSIPSAPECCAGMLCAGMLWAGMGLHRMRPAENDTVDRRRWAIKRPWLLPLLLLTVDSNQNKISSIIARFSHSMSARVCVCVCVCALRFQLIGLMLITHVTTLPHFNIRRFQRHLPSFRLRPAIAVIYFNMGRAGLVGFQGDLSVLAGLATLEGQHVHPLPMEWRVVCFPRPPLRR